jgi:hypothetical protein
MGVAAILLLLAWFFLGSAEAPVVKAPRQGVGRVARRVQAPPPVVEKNPIAAAAKLPDPEVATVTAPCKYIIQWTAAGSPDFVILDNLEAQAQMFDDEDLKCLTAGGASNAVLEYAERNQKSKNLNGGKIRVIGN